MDVLRTGDVSLMARGQDPAHQPEVSPLPCGRVCWWGMHTHRVMQGRFPYCPVPSGLSPGGRKRGRGHATLSPVLRGEEGRWEFLLATCRSAGSLSSYQERDGTSVGGLGCEQKPQPAGGHGPVASACSGRWLRASSFLELITESQLLSVLPDEPSCWLALPTSSQPIPHTFSSQHWDFLIISFTSGDKDLI